MSTDLKTSDNISPKKRGFHMGIKLKSLLLLGSLLTIVVSVAMSLFLYKARQDNEDNLSNRLELLSELQAHSLISPVWNMDYNEIEKILQSCLKDQALVDASVYDTHNNLVKQVKGSKESGDEDLLAMKIIGDNLASIRISFSKNDLNNTLREETIQGIELTAILLIIILGTSYFCLSMIINPLNKIKDNVVDIADGKFDVNIGFLKRKDEIGSMAHAVLVLLNNAINSEKFRKEKEKEKLKDAELKKQEMDNLAQNFQDSIKKSWDDSMTTTKQILISNNLLLEAVHHTKERCHNVYKLSTIASNNVSNVVGAVEEMSISGKAISTQAQDSAKKLEEASVNIKQSNSSVRNLIQTTKGIQDIITLINNIATRTNLLALNATIEAASAGEHGKGFAVVASEVKELSRQTSQATQKIQEQLKNVDVISDEVASNIMKGADMLEKVTNIIIVTLTSVSEQAQAINQIAENMTETLKCSEETKTNSDDMIKSVSESEKVVDEVVSGVSILEQYMSIMQKEINNFLKTIRNHEK